MNYVGQIWRPPSEAESLILQVTVGCSHNRCTFCVMYKDKEFYIKPLEDIRAEIADAARVLPGMRRIFLADGDALRIPTADLLQILQMLRKAFPRLTRVTTYAGPRSILDKSVEELTALREAGLKIAYLGLESGHPDILRQIKKGATPEEMIAAVKRLHAAGIKVSVTVILGLGGLERSEDHAKATADVVNAMLPDYLSALTLMVAPDTPLADDIHSGKFELLNPHQALQELYWLIEGTAVSEPCIFRSNHASNYFAVGGTLPKDREAMLAEIREVMGDLSGDELKPEWLRGL